MGNCAVVITRISTYNKGTIRGLRADIESVIDHTCLVLLSYGLPGLLVGVRQRDR